MWEEPQAPNRTHQEVEEGPEVPPTFSTPAFLEWGLRLEPTTFLELTP